MNFSWPYRAAGKTARRSAARVGLVAIAAVTVAGAAALAAPAMSAMAATGNATTTVVTNPFPITEPADTPATVNVEVTDTVPGGPAPTGTVLLTTDVPWAENYPGVAAQCTADLTPAAGVNGDGEAYSTGSCSIGGDGWGFIEVGAIYSGDANNATSNTDGTEVKIINLMPTTTTLAPNTATAGEAVTLVATVGPGNILSGYSEIFNGPAPADTVDFTVTGANGTATCTNVPLGGPIGAADPPNYADCAVTLPAGTYTVTAVFAGDEYAATSTGTETLTVNPLVAATTTTMSGVSGSVGGKITLAAEVAGGSTPTGTVKFVYGGKTLCSASLSNGAADCTHTFAAVGSFKVEAVYAGDATHKASSGLATVKVTKQPTSVKVAASPASTGKAVKLTATVKSLSLATGTVTFYVNGHKVCTAKVSGGKASCNYTWHAKGNYTVTAVYSGNSTHLGSKGTVSVTVTS